MDTQRAFEVRSKLLELRQIEHEEFCDAKTSALDKVRVMELAQELFRLAKAAGMKVILTADAATPHRDFQSCMASVYLKGAQQPALQRTVR
jgi:biopolymer transport protein ExbD